MLIAFRGMKAVEKAAFAATYKTVWCAGPAIDHVTAILPMKDILLTLIDGFTKETNSRVRAAEHLSGNPPIN